MARRTPARPSVVGEGTTTSQAKGGLFTDTDGVGVSLSGIQGEQGPVGPAGPTGATGQQGPQGDRGPQGNMGNPGNDGAAGATGPAGPVPEISAREMDLPAGSQPTATIEGGTGEMGDPYRLVIGIPRGADGNTPSFDPPTITTLPPGSNATVTLTGTGTSIDPYVLNFGIPRGDVGDQGDDGLIFVPIYYTEGGVPAISNVSLIEDEVHTHVTYYRSDNPLRILLFGGPNSTYDPDNPSLDANAAQTLQTHLSDGSLGNHTLGAAGTDGATGPQGPQGDRGAVGPTGPVGPQGEQGEQGDRGVSIQTVVGENAGVPGSTTTVTVTLDDGSIMRFNIPAGQMGAAGQGTSTTFLEGLGINITTDPADPTRVTIASERDAYNIQSRPINGSPPGGTLNQLLEYNPTTSQWEYVNFPTGHASANDSTISIDTGDHLSIATGNESLVVGGVVQFSTNQSANETITLDVHALDDPADFVAPISTENQNALVAANVLRQAIDEAGAPSGDQFPMSPAPELGDEFILIGHATLTDGFYFYNGSDWVKDSSYHGSGLPPAADYALGDRFVVTTSTIDGLEGQWFHDGTSWIKDDTTYGFTDGRQGTFVVTPSNGLVDGSPVTVEASGVRPWRSGIAYAAGDQVLYGVETGDLRGVYSVYIRTIADDEGTNPIDLAVAPEAGGGTSRGWRLSRAGLVRLQTDGNNVATGVTDTGDGVTANSTLRIHQGSGVSITRDVTTFNIGLVGTHHNSDAEDFTPGWAYSFYDIENDLARTGTIGNSLGDVVFNEGFFIRAGVRLIFQSGSGLFSEGEHFAFRTYGTENVPDGETAGTRTILFPGAAEDYIVYCQRTTSPTNTAEATILQVDPAISTARELGGLFFNNNTFTDGDRRVFNPSASFSVFGLVEHHNTPASGIAPWAVANSTETVPGNKLESLSEAPPTHWADSTATEENPFAPIADGWLPTDIVRTSNSIDVLNDITLTEPTETPVVEGLLWDADGGPEGNGEWINAPISQTLEGLTDTAIPTPGNEQYLQYSTERGNDAQGDPLPPAWVAVDLPTMASGRIEFTAQNSSFVATGFIENPDMPDNIVPISRTSITGGNGSQLEFFVARTANLSLNTLNFTALPWDQPFPGAQTALGFSSNDDPLYPTQTLQDLEPVTPNSNILINPSTGVGPWSVSFDNTGLVQSNSVATDRTAGGNFPAIAFTAVNNVTGTAAPNANGMGVTWENAGLTQRADRFTGSNTFLETITGYAFTFVVENISVNNNARWEANSSTLNGGTTTTVDSLANTPGNAGAIGGSSIVTVNVPDYNVYNRQTVPGDSVGVRLNRPATVTGTQYDFVERLVVTDDPIWTYPVFWLNDASNTTPPDFVNNGTQILNNTGRSRTINDLSDIDYTNSTGVTQYIWVAYTTGSPTVLRVDVRTRRGTADVTNTITLSGFQQSSTDLSFINPDPNTPADAAELYKWFWIEVPDGERVTFGTVGT